MCDDRGEDATALSAFERSRRQLPCEAHARPATRGSGRPRNCDGQSVVQRQPQRSSWTRNRTTRPESGEPAGWSPVTQWMPTATSIPKSPDPGLRHIQVAITAGHPGNRGNASAGKHGDHQARAARAGVVDKLGIVDVLTEKRGAFLQYGCGSGPKLLNSTDPDGGSADIDDDICADPPA